MSQSIDQQENPFIQGYRIGTMRPKSRTEVARTICRQYKWCFNDDDQVIEGPNGAVIGDTIEDITAAMIDTKWIQHSKANIGGWLPYWDVSPDDPHQAAVQLRQLLDEDGYHKNWRKRMYEERRARK